MRNHSVDGSKQTHTDKLREIGQSIKNTIKQERSDYLTSLI